MTLLRRAWNSLDAGQLADVGLRLAEGERVLHRSHKAASAEQVLSLAIRTAVARQDQATLERLTAALQSSAKKELLEELAASQKQLQTASDAVPPTATPPDDVVPSESAAYHSAVRAALAARIVGDVEGLKGFSQAVQALELSPATRKHLSRVIEDSLRATPEGQPDNPLLRVLNRLSETSGAGECNACQGAGCLACGWCGGDGIRNGYKCSFCGIYPCKVGWMRCWKCKGTGQE
jgi:hypothetical protein